jgi:pentatricopeptide repeat protein
MIMTANHEFNTIADATMFGGHYSELLLTLAFLAGFVLCSSERIRMFLEWLVPTKKISTPCAKKLDELEEEEEVVLDDAEEQVESPAFALKEPASPKNNFDLVVYKLESVEDPFFKEALAAAAQLPVSDEVTPCSWLAASTEDQHEKSKAAFALHGASVEEALCQWRCCQENSGDTEGHLLGAVVEVCVAAGAVDEAFDVASEACWNIPPCSAGQKAMLRLIEALADHGNLSRAYEAYSNVHANGLEMDLNMYHAMLSTAARAADLEKLERLFEDLVDAGIEPEYSTFSTVIRGYCAASDLDKAMALFGCMREHGIAPSQALFNALLDCCARKQMIVLTEQILKDMMDNGVHPNSTTLTILVRLYGHGRDLESAFRVTDELSERYNIELVGDTCAALIAASLLNNQLDSALGVIEDMPSEGCVLPARTYEILIRACLKNGDLDNAVALVDNAFGLNCEGQQSRARLDRILIEDVLRLVGKRRQSATLGAPLLRRLMAANIDISDELVTSVLRDAERPVQASWFQARRNTHDAWRTVL